MLNMIVFLHIRMLTIITNYLLEGLELSLVFQLVDDKMV